MRSRINYKTDVIFFFVLLIILIMSAGGHIVQGDAETMFRVTQNLLNGSGISVGKESFIFPGQPAPLLPAKDVEVITTSAVPGLGGKTYSKYGMGQSLLAMPLYFLGDWLETIGLGRNRMDIDGWSSRLWVSMLNPIALAGCGWLMFVMGGEFGYSKRTSLWVSVAALFSTMMWPYVKEFYPQPTVGFFLLLAVFAAYRWKISRNSVWCWVLSGSLGFMIMIRLSSAIVLVPFVVYLFSISPGSKKWRWIGRLFLGIGLGLFWTALYNQVRFGSFLETGYHEAVWDNPFFLGMYGLLFSPGKGIFLYAPLTILSGIGLWMLARQYKAESLLFSGISLTLLVFYAPYRFWTGGFNWGPRFLLPIIPLLILPLGGLLEDNVIIGAKTMFIILFCFGFFVQVPAILVDHSRYMFQIIEEDSSVTISDTVVDPNHSPIPKQWSTAMDLIRDYLQPGTRKLIIQQRNRIKYSAPNIQNGAAILISDFIRRNTLDFWWLNLAAW